MLDAYLIKSFSTREKQRQKLMEGRESVPFCISFFLLFVNSVNLFKQGGQKTQRARESKVKKLSQKEMKKLKGEVELNIPAETAWQMYRDNEIMSKINPDLLSLALYIHGDGTPGSLRLLHLGRAVQGYVKESTEKIESVEVGRSVTYRVIAGGLSNMYDPYRVTFSFHPLPGNGSKCIAEWEAEFEPVSPAIPPPEKARDAALWFLKSFDKFQVSSSC